jgi:myo-inositol-1(or 4)-monophosphatase
LVHEGNGVSLPSTSDLLAVAEATARAAGAHALRHQARRQEAVERTAHDVKLVLDHECQAVAEGVIHGAFPQHHFLGEEGGSAGDGSQPLWIVDPIDGTVNFSHGIPYWCSSVAVQVNGRVVAGAVFAPVLNHLYAASADSIATCNGEPIHVSETAELGRALVLTGVERNFDQYPESTAVVTGVVSRIQKLRLMGAAALDLCMVADGRADAFYESGLNLWDVAAAAHIVERAGGFTEVPVRLPNGRLRFIATNARLREPFLQLLKTYPRWWNPA